MKPVVVETKAPETTITLTELTRQILEQQNPIKQPFADAFGKAGTEAVAKWPKRDPWEGRDLNGEYKILVGRASSMENHIANLTAKAAEMTDKLNAMRAVIVELNESDRGSDKMLARQKQPAADALEAEIAGGHKRIEGFKKVLQQRMDEVNAFPVDRMKKQNRYNTAVLRAKNL